MRRPAYRRTSGKVLRQVPKQSQLQLRRPDEGYGSGYHRCCQCGGNRTGMKLLNDSFNLFGYFAKILIALCSGTQKSVSVELNAMALGCWARWPAIDARRLGPPLRRRWRARSEGTINFNTSPPRPSALPARQGLRRGHQQRTAGATEPARSRVCVQKSTSKRATGGRHPTKEIMVSPAWSVSLGDD